MSEWTQRRQEELRAEYLAAPEGTEPPNTLSPEEEGALEEIEAEIRRHLDINFAIRGRAADAILYEESHGGHGYVDIMIDRFLTEGKDLNEVVNDAASRRGYKR